MKGSFDSASDRTGKSIEAKMNRLKKALQQLDTLVIDAKYLASEISFDDLLTESDEYLGRKSKSQQSYKRATKSEDWGAEIDKTSFVYFVLLPQANAVKIGYTQDLRSRISCLQVGNPFQLKILGWMFGGIRQEKTVHDFFSRYHTGRGEWFYFEGDLYDYILDVIRTQPEYIDPKKWSKGQSPDFTYETFLGSSEILLIEADEFLEKPALSGVASKETTTLNPAIAKRFISGSSAGG